MIAALLPTGVGSRPFQDSFVLDFLVLFFLKKHTKKLSFYKLELSQLQTHYLATALTTVRNS